MKFQTMWRINFIKYMDCFSQFHNSLRIDYVESFGINHQEDMEKGYTANALNYYMNEHGVTKEEASRELEKMNGDMNKIVNEECLKITTMPRRILMQSVNYARSLDVLYTADDVYNHREGKLKEYMRLLLVDPILL